jgi:ATP-dependent protease HslVU (ClpYQ) peptidase subunit
MTVIAWDGRTLAADRLASFGTTRCTTTKIFRVRDGGLAGYAGDAAFGEQVLAWYEAGAFPLNFPASQRDRDDWAGLLVIQSNGELLRYERTPYPVKYQDKHFAIGSGREFALAAMHLGCDAVRAVEVACALDTGCGNGIDVLTLGFNQFEGCTATPGLLKTDPTGWYFS